ncbi:MAG TPA: MBL fold metallo-hydrolase [Candidatus Aminicenantes bacterium]|nr:MBL fold metallo-hydrolase [Candidatus Aminicenantes bacterium]
MKKPICWLAVTLLAGGAFAQTPVDPAIRVERLSARVLLLTEESPMENLVVAIATRKGLVVVDTTGSRQTAAFVRQAIETQFARSDFKYVINTHPHWDHAWGNQAFPEAEVIIQENGARQLADSEGTAERARTGFRERIAALKTELAEPNLDPRRKGKLAGDLAFRERVVQGLSAGFAPPRATVSFSDEMTLDMGDVTFRLCFFGRAHSGCDIFIHIPEEKILITGDIFLDKGWLPLFAGMDTLDIPRWIAVLNKLFADPAGFTTVIPGHRGPWSREKLALWKGYIEDLWKGVQAARSEKLTLAQATSRLPLPARFDYLKELNHSQDELLRFQQRNVTAFWRQLLIPVVPMMAETLERQGVEAAIQQGRTLWQSRQGDYSFSETALNQFGYRLLDREDKKPAIELFKFVVELYPDSANAYDSLGEAFMAGGDKRLAIENYERSLRLNPANGNATAMLKRLRQEE